jgi:hypothetical protein
MKAFALLCCALLAACAVLPEAKHAPQWNPDKLPRFGDWYGDPEACTLAGNSPDAHLTTDGELRGEQLTFRLGFDRPLVRPPHATVSGLPIVLVLEGSGRDFTFTLPYVPTTAAHMLEPDTYLIVSYQPLDSAAALEVSFQTRGLVHGLAYLGHNCK